MNKNILITYASKYGSTGEIAHKISAVLRQAGWQTTILPVNGSIDLGSYSAVILGSAVYISKWQKEATAFLQSNEKILASLPVWLFSSGPTGQGDPIELLEGWHLPQDIQPVSERIQPRGTTVFHGFINPQKLNFIEKQVIKSIKKPIGDFRDWDAIAKWATSIAKSLDGSIA